MPQFERTTLWRNSFGSDRFASDSDAVIALREQLLDMRTRVAYLVSLIVRDVPGLTLHDITHLDALWETASLVAGDDYFLNPAEAYVLGAAILLHDSAMSLAAYPGGLAEVQQTPQWRDAVAARLNAETEGRVDRQRIDSPPTAVATAAVGDVLRELHASRAKHLALLEWPTKDGSPEYLIQQSDTRNAYGSIIGNIASSHWWPTTELGALPPQVNAGPGVPSDWVVRPVKLACLLRAADVTQIDHRRAPLFLRTLLAPTGESEMHWAFQSKLAKPSRENASVIFTGSPFAVRDADAWWLCYDMLNFADRELRATQSLLERNHLAPFAASSVKGAHSVEAVAELIPTEGWHPVDTAVHISDVPTVVELLGGEKLYGRNNSVPIRELIQNSTDATRARRLLSDPSTYSGTVVVRVREDQGWWLDVEDDGIGMSTEVLTNALLDFGRSLWKSSLVRREFPGLVSKGLASVGQFGIGFFSVFMLGKVVTVTTRRYDLGAADTHTLAFSNGVRSRPILRPPVASEALSTAGTRVSIKLEVPPAEPEGLLHRGQTQNGENLVEALSDFVAKVCPATETKLIIQDADGTRSEIHAGDWLTAEASVLLDRVTSLETGEEELRRVAPNMRPLQSVDSREYFGRAAVAPSRSRYSETNGVVAVGGFRACKIAGIAGVLRGTTQTVVRDQADPDVPGPVLRMWATEQAKLIHDSSWQPWRKLSAARKVMALGGSCEPLPIVIRAGEYLSAKDLGPLLAQLDSIVVFEEESVDYDDDVDQVLKREFEQHFEADAEMFLLPTDIPRFLKSDWPSSVPDLYIHGAAKTAEEAFLLALEAAWGGVPDYSDEEEQPVGDVLGTSIIRSVRIYDRADLAAEPGLNS